LIGTTLLLQSGSMAAKSTQPKNCLDRHVVDGRGDEIAIYWVGEWVGEPGGTRNITFSELLRETCHFDNAMIGRGVVSLRR
jgi:acetyl-CoA synthetase